MRFVIADDASIQRDKLRHYLQTAGFEVVAAVENGRLAIAECRRLAEAGACADAVVFDVIMPEMTGDAAARIVVAERLARHVFLASLTLQEAIVGELRALGVHPIAKPYRPSSLLAQIADGVATDKAAATD